MVVGVLVCWLVFVAGCSGCVWLLWLVLVCLVVAGWVFWFGCGLRKRWFGVLVVCRFGLMCMLCFGWLVW